MQLDLRIFSFFFTAEQTFDESYSSIMLSRYMCLLSVQRTFLTFPHPGLVLDGMDVLLIEVESAFFSCDAFYEWADTSQYFHQGETEDKAGFHIQVQFPGMLKVTINSTIEPLKRHSILMYKTEHWLQRRFSQGTKHKILKSLKVYLYLFI